MSRRSNRLKAKLAGEEVPEAPAAPSSKAMTKPKKRKVASELTPSSDKVEGQRDTAARKGVSSFNEKPKKGSLKMMLELPLDVLLEVFQHLDPADLLSLSKTERTFRAYLLKRSTALPWWKAAFERVDPNPPACPPDLSLPQYANLLYGRTCFYCNTTQGLTRSWVAYIRACKSCLKDDKLFDYSYANTHGTPRAITPTIIYKDGRRRMRKFLVEEFANNMRTIEDLENEDDRKEYKAFVKLKSRTLRGREQRQRNLFQYWDDRQAQEKEKDLATRRDNRKEDILRMLRESGYAEQLQHLDQVEIDRLPGINGIKALTDKEWDRVKAGIVAVFDGKQRDANNAIRRDFIAARTALLQYPLRYSFSHNRELDPPHIPATQLAKLEPFRTLIYDTPEGTELQEKDLVKHVDAIPKVLEAWRAEAEEFVLGLLPVSMTRGKEGKGGLKLTEMGKLLNLATSIFYCEWCGPKHPFTYPLALEHHCLFERHSPQQTHSYRPSKNPRKRDEDRKIIYLKEEDEADPNASWNEGGKQLVFFSKASEFATAIIRALGRDPGVVTWEELDEANERLECLHCRLPDDSKHRLKRVVMGWRQAILHQLDSYNMHSKFQGDKRKKCFTFENCWRKLDAASLAKAYKKEGSSVEADARCYYCVECGVMSLTVTTV